MPDIKQDIIDDDYVSLNNLLKIDELTKTMEYGLTNVSYHFIPKTHNGELIIYHQGHRGDFKHGLETMKYFLNKGYAVIGMSMPLLGKNNQPILPFERFGQVRMNHHDALRLLKPAKGHPIQYFFEGVLAAVNYGESLGYKRISMVGLSGGAWTTTLYAALDERIAKSYPVAGSQPLYVRSAQAPNKKWGDYEHLVIDLYSKVNYLELYILGSYGKDRNQKQILNEFDPCCYSGKNYKTYEGNVERIVKRLGKGRFDVFLDSTHEEHKISDVALEVILKDLQN